MHRIQWTSACLSFFPHDMFLSSKQCCLFWNKSFHWKKGILHTYNHDLHLSKKSTYTQGFYFIVMFLRIIAWFQPTGPLPCEGVFAHTCSDTFFTTVGQNGYSKASILSQRCPPSRISFTSSTKLRTAVTLFENNSIFLSKACCTPVCKGTV